MKKKKKMYKTQRFYYAKVTYSKQGSCDNAVKGLHTLLAAVPWQEPETLYWQTRRGCHCSNPPQNIYCLLPGHINSMGTNLEWACRLESHSKVHIPHLLHTCFRSVLQNVLKLMNEQLTFYEAQARDGSPHIFLMSECKLFYVTVKNKLLWKCRVHMLWLAVPQWEHGGYI